MQEMFGFANIPAIVVICMLIAEGLKLKTKVSNEYLPVICGFIGGALGILAMYVMADFPAADPITAAAIGIASGFAATGVHQAYKQVKNSNNTEMGSDQE